MGNVLSKENYQKRPIKRDLSKETYQKRPVKRDLAAAEERYIHHIYI